MCLASRFARVCSDFVLLARYTTFFPVKKRPGKFISDDAFVTIKWCITTACVRTNTRIIKQTQTWHLVLPFWWFDRIREIRFFTISCFFYSFFFSCFFFLRPSEQWTVNIQNEVCYVYTVAEMAKWTKAVICPLCVVL